MFIERFSILFFFLSISKTSMLNSLCLEALHTVTHHQIRVTTKPDRGKLCVIVEQGRQILQAKYAAFAQPQDCTDFMIGMAKDFAENRIMKQDLKRIRDEKFAALGIKVLSY